MPPQNDRKGAVQAASKRQLLVWYLRNYACWAASFISVANGSPR